MYTVGISSFYLGYGGLMIALLQVPLTTRDGFGRLLKPFSYIGQHSYPIYLFHILIMEQLLKHDLLNTGFGIVTYFASTITIGILLSKLIEFPVLHLQDRIFPAEVLAGAAHRVVQGMTRWMGLDLIFPIRLFVII